MRLLIVGSLEGQIGLASRIAMDRGAEVSHVGDVDAGLDFIRGGRGADLVMIDVRADIRGFIDSLKSERIVIPVVACGIGTDANAAVRAIKAGAKEYLPLPPEPELIAAILQAVTEDSRSLVYRDPRMAQLMGLAEQVAPSSATILITGDSGTGKELMARYVHRKSKRAKQRFVAINCAAIPENLLESELFGHEKGAFTGAVARRVGKFEEANGGTLLLDEISEMDTRLQAKLLRAIQEREIDRVGGTQPVKVDVRLIATSNRALEDEVRKGNFREDLYFRLNVVNLDMPPLRERPADIQILAEHFANKYAEANDVPPPAITPQAMAKLTAHHWRGNVRELENTLHRAVLMSRGGDIEPQAITLTGGALYDDAPAAGGGQQPAAGPVLPGSGVPGGLIGRTVADVERDLIIDTLQHCLGNRTQAANILGISIRTLRNKLKLYSGDGTPVPGPGEASRPAP
ncbi:MAG: sigma-54 dependent transcriptional regulator [Acetobacterales bacterium]